MKKSFVILIVLIFSGCGSSKLYKEYSLYRRDKHINYPDEKLSIELLNDTTGLFFNKRKDKELFKQTFNYQKINSDYLVISDINPIDPNLLALNKGDTIVVDRSQLHFFYEGEKKYLLSFKKKLFRFGRLPDDPDKED